MNIKVIGCKVMLRQLYRMAAVSRNTVDIRWMRQELHETPADMAVALQRAIEQVEEEETPYDAIALAYGLCSNGIVGLHARKTPLVIARAHDCITLFLGDRRRYQELFDAGHGGIYWYSQGWIENTRMPGKARMEELYQRYAEKYGEDNAAFLMEEEQGWMKPYHTAAYIGWPGDGEAPEAYARECANYFAWDFVRHQGDEALLRDLLDGPWDEDRYLLVPPGCRIVADYTGGILAASPIDGGRVIES